MDWLPVFSKARFRQLVGDDVAAALPLGQPDGGKNLHSRGLRSLNIDAERSTLFPMAFAAGKDAEARAHFKSYFLASAMASRRENTRENLDEATETLERVLCNAQDERLRTDCLEFLASINGKRIESTAPIDPPVKKYHSDMHFCPPTLPPSRSIPGDQQLQTRRAERADITSIDGLDQQLKVNLHEILGHGSNGTTVYSGRLGAEDVAVKRMLAHHELATTKEIDILRKISNHPNVVRYYYHEKRDQFQYIVLDRCQASLAKVVTTLPEANLRQLLQQIAVGLNHLHVNGVIHRDLKPSNILLRDTHPGPPRLVLSDFGLSKTVDADQSSLTATYAAGTIGWRAPDAYAGAEGGAVPLRASKKNDIFSMGLVFYFVLTRGQHPFCRDRNDEYKREYNIGEGAYNLDGLDVANNNDKNYNTVEARHLIEWMLCVDPDKRPKIAQVLMHPFFWDAQTHLNFLCKASDNLEPERRRVSFSVALAELEAMRDRVFNGNFLDELPGPLRDHVTKKRRYNGTKLQELLRLVRNLCHHYYEQPEAMQQLLGPMPSGFLQFWNSRFPQLSLSCWSLSRWKNIPDFERYFKVKDDSGV